MPTNDWVRERAEAVVTTTAFGRQHVAAMLEVVSAALWEAIDRTRSEERALAAEALKMAKTVQEKAVAAERDDAVHKMREAGERAVGRARVAERQSILDRLRNPDEALVEAFQDASDEYYNADHDVTLEGWFTHICRAIAANLAEKEG